MRSAHVVGGWAAANFGLALGLLAFGPAPLPVLLHVGSAVVVAAFGVAALLALRTGNVGTQHRQPRRAAAAAFTAFATTVALGGFVYGWWMSVLAVYPLLMALWMARGERLHAGVRPWPAALDDAESAGPPRLVHHGTSPGTATGIPEDHPAHGPPETSRRPEHRRRTVALLIVAARAVVDLLRRRRR